MRIPRLRSSARALGMLALVLPPSAAGQVPAAGAELETHVEAIDVDYVLVPVTVHERRGRPLERSDFRLSVDGMAVEIESFERGGELPLDLFILQDLSGSMSIGRKLEASRDVVDCLAGWLPANGRLALASFAGGRVELVAPVGSGRELVAATVADFSAFGNTALLDALATLPALARSGGPRRAAVVLTDGAENASRLEPEVAERLLRAADLPVYPVLVGRAGRGAAGWRAFLRRLGETTGGGLLGAAGACDEIADALARQYVLGFSTAAAGGPAWREIRVDIARPRLRYGYRRGYDGRAPKAPAPMR